MNDWIEIIRDANYFNLTVANQKKKLGHNVAVRLPCRKDAITISYDDVYHVNALTDGINGMPPTFISGTEAKVFADDSSTQENIIPHAEDPAPAQRASNLGLFWGSASQPSLPFGKKSMHAHRDDGFPAVIVMVNVSKHYHHGVLHRKRKLPAISADYIGALWFEGEGHNIRRNGPATIVLENYKEFWEDGEFKGHRWSNYNLSWAWGNAQYDEAALNKFLGNLQGKTDLFSNTYFTDIQDEVCFIADFA